MRELVHVQGGQCGNQAILPNIDTFLANRNPPPLAATVIILISLDAVRLCIGDYSGVGGVHY